MLKKNDEAQITIDDLSHDGDGIGRADGFTFFVPGALPKEKINMKVLKIKKNYGFGKLLSIASPSPFRIEPACRHFRYCGGCSLMHYDYAKQLELKTRIVKNCLERIGGITDAPVMDTIGMKNPVAFRNKGMFPIGAFDGRFIAGFYSRKSHNVNPIEGCLIINPLNDAIIRTVNSLITKLDTSVYDEIKHSGILRHLVTRTSSIDSKTHVCFVINGKTLPHLDLFIAELTKIPQISAIHLCINTERTNVIMGKEFKTVFGSEYLVDSILGLNFKISPLSFFQTNHIQTEVLYSKILEFAKFNSDDILLDAYCGIGSITLCAAKYVKKAIGVEVIPQAVENAKENAVLNSINNSSFICGTAENETPKLISSGLSPSIIIVDPPRKGCAVPLLEVISASSARRLIYVSCDPATLARDIKLLTPRGFQVMAVQPIDMFPWTTHVESVVLISRIEH